MTFETMTVGDLGEKKIISDIIKPLVNPYNKKNLAGDDCALIPTENIDFISTSTDRVPADLLSFKLGLIDFEELGEYLATLNISDVLSSGATPKGLLLNLAFPHDFLVKDLKSIMIGARNVCNRHNCEVIGGDLSDSSEMSLSATSIGLVKKNKAIYRQGAKVSDYIFCSKVIGLTPTAFEYFTVAKPKGMTLSSEEEQILINQFKNLKLNTDFIDKLTLLKSTVCAMDNTDGVAQSLLELSEINELSFIIDESKIKYHPISLKVADFLKMNVMDLILKSGADFQLLGTIDKEYKQEEIVSNLEDLNIIGECVEGDVGLFMKKLDGSVEKVHVQGWNYFK